MNPIFGMMPRMMGGMNGGIGNMMNMIQSIKQAQQNPSMLADLLFKNGKISQQQYEEIKKFNGNPQMIGQYLMQTGTMPQQQVQQAYQTMIPQVQEQLKNP